jgi:hypothetical protein
MSKLAITCLDFKPVAKNTLRGFATIRIAEMRLIIHDVAIHARGDARWAALPAKPQITKEGTVVVRDGKTQYVTILEFADAGTRNAFSSAVIRAVLDFAPGALDHVEEITS